MTDSPSLPDDIRSMFDLPHLPQMILLELFVQVSQEVLTRFATGPHFDHFGLDAIVGTNATASLIILKGDNQKDIHERIRRLASKSGPRVDKVFVNEHGPLDPNA